MTGIDLHRWRQLMQIDIDAVFLGGRRTMPHLVHSKGCIVNVASIARIAGDHSFAAYSAANPAVVNLTRSMALDHAPDVRISSVNPWLTGSAAVMEA